MGNQGRAFAFYLMRMQVMKKRSVLTITLNPAVDQTLYIDDFRTGHVNRVQDHRHDAGGKGVNVAGFLADYGMTVTATGFLGAGNSLIFRQYFSEKGIQDKFFRLTGHTRTGIKIVDSLSELTTDINFPGIEPAADDVEDLLRLIDETGDQFSWAVLAGSVPSSVSADIYARLTERLTSKGVKMAMDASGEPFIKGLSDALDLVKPNLEELAEYSGAPVETREEILTIGKQILLSGVKTVAVSMGRNGALFLEKEQILEAVPPRVTAVSTVGAGDAMVSGLVAGKLAGKSFEECVRLATAFSVLAVTGVGAGIRSMERLKELETEVVVNTLT